MLKREQAPHRIVILYCALISSLLLAIPAFAEKRIIFFGDSLTAGFGVAQSEAFPALLEKELTPLLKERYSFINAGVSGNTTAGGVSRITPTIAAGCDVIVIALGANDGLRVLPPTVTESNLSKIITTIKAQQPHCQIILAGIRLPEQYGTRYGQDFLALYAKLAKEHQVGLIPFLLQPIAGNMLYFQSDVMHPNAAGHLQIAHYLAPFIKKALSLSF